MKNKITFFLIICSARLLHAMDKAEIENTLLNKPKLLQEVAAHRSRAARFTRDGSSLVLGCDNNFLVYDVLNYKQPKLTVPLAGGNISVDTSPMLPTCAAIGNSSMSVSASIWNIKEGKKLVDLPDATVFAYTIEYSNDGTQVLTATPQGCQIVNLGTNSITTVNSTSMVTARFNPIDNNMLACATLEQTSSSIVSIYDLRTNKPTNLANHLPVYGLEFNPDGSKLVSISPNNFGVWDAKSAALINYLNVKGQEGSKPVHEPKGYAESLAFIPGTNIFIAALNNINATICDISRPQENIQFNLNPNGDSFAFDISPDGKTLVNGSYAQNSLRIWDISQVKEALKEKYRKSREELPQFNIEGDEIVEAAVIEQAFGIPASASAPAQGSRFKCSLF